MPVTLIRYAGTNAKNLRYTQGMAGIMRIAADRGWRTCIVLSRPPEEDRWLDPLREIGTLVEYLPRARGNFDLGCMRRTFGLCRRLDATIFHCDNIHASPMIGAALAGCPVRVWSRRSMQPAYEACRSPTWRDRLAPSVRSTTRLATRVLAVSVAVRSELTDLGLPGSKISVFPNECERPNVSNFDRQAARAELGISPGELVIVSIGRIEPVKGWDVLLDAFAEICRRGHGVRLLLVGSCSLATEQGFFASLRQRIEAQKLQDRITFTGHVEDVYPALVASDIFVMPSRSEGDPNALLQALTAGKACVATRVGGAPDLIQDGVNGLLVPRADSAALVGAVSTLLSDSELRSRLAAVAASQKHAPSSREYAQRLVDLYADLLHERVPALCEDRPRTLVRASSDGSTG